MESILLNGNDQYEVQFASVVTDYDRKLLLRLYQPLCGYGPIAIYLTLTSELDAERTISTTFKAHSRLFEMMSITADEFLKCRHYLEALGLLKTFISEGVKENKYVYQLKAPLMPNRFYTHPVLDNMLRKNLSEEEYERTKIYFSDRIKIKNNYKDISVRFQDVYAKVESMAIDDTAHQLKGHYEGQIQLDFDYEAFFVGLKEYQIPKSSINEVNLNQIASLAILYNISAIEMRNLVAQSLELFDNRKIINVERLSLIAKRYYEGKNVVLPHVSNEKKAPSPIMSGDSNTKIKLDLFISNTPREFLKYRNNNIEPLACDITLIAQLKQETGLEDEVINVILDYCLQVNDNRLIPNYIKKVAASILRSNIHDAYAAMKYLTKARGKKNKVEDDDNNANSDKKDDTNANNGTILEENKWW